MARHLHIVAVVTSCWYILNNRESYSRLWASFIVQGPRSLFLTLQ